MAGFEVVHGGQIYVKVILNFEGKLHEFLINSRMLVVLSRKNNNCIQARTRCIKKRKKNVSSPKRTPKIERILRNVGYRF